MATRFWLTNAAAPYTPATRRGAWDVASGEDVQLLGRKPQGSAGTSSINVGSTSADRDVLLHRSISAGAVKAGTISGTVEWTIGVKESNVDLNGFWHLHVYVTSGDTDTPRGTLLTDYIGSTEFTTTATGIDPGAQTVTPVAIQVGDRIVVEIGYRANALATTYNATVNYGNTGGTDLAASDTAVTTEPGWVEFSGTDGLFTAGFGTLTDAFTSSIDSKWTKSAGVTATGGRARIPTTTTLESLYTATAYEIQGTSAAFQVPSVPVAGGGSGVSVAAYLSAGPTVSTTNLEIVYSPNTGNLQFRNNVGGSDASPTNITYDSTAHAWWRFHEAAGSITMDTSPDGVTWTTRRTISTLTQWMRVGNQILYFESVRTSGTNDFAEIDSVNVVANTTIALSAAGSTETAQHLAAAKQRTAGIAAGIETAQRLTGVKQRTATLAAAVETARHVAGTKTAVLGIAYATAATQHPAAAKTRQLNPAQEQASAAGLVATKTRALSPATATAQAQHPAGAKQAQLGAARQTATSQTLLTAKTRSLGRAAETESARVLAAPVPGLTHGLALTDRPATAWTASAATAAWACTGRTAAVDSLSTEYLEVGVTWSRGDPSTSAVQMAVVPLGHDPADTDWHTAQWDTDTAGLTVAKLLVGPDGGALAPTPGRYRAWVSIDAPPEHPVLSTPPYDIS
ncbi:hypothetical protein GCM10010193_70410 [Kitasatospora atroaurantiaca]|uniref:Uncharacterized protein n=1 Tax=Kitasatospora atroaurantiaca TaxID=285545 RepID=A0A561END0_9ACTN|nr:hypothetical protein [Kitasatospora atroaurantiaca]TWE17126.1 hypothetical protein FB465_2131 [Kitasatospora atroaurantiaca]